MTVSNLKNGATLAPDPKQQALALALEFAKRVVEAESLDDLQFMLTNDARILVPFDRAFLITHLGGESRLAAVMHQPEISKKSHFSQLVNELAPHLRKVDKGIWLSDKTDANMLPKDELAPEIRDRLLAYLDQFNGFSLLCVPLKHNQIVLAHVVMEFDKRNIPGKVEILAFLAIAPFLGAALAEKWLLHKKPSVWELVAPVEAIGDRVRTRLRRGVIGAFLVIVVVFWLFLFPMTRTVGGECEVVPRNHRMAFVKIEGLVKEITVKEGDSVKKGQVLAVLDRRELDHEIANTERKVNILTQEMNLYRKESATDPSRLAESELINLKRLSALAELEFLKWKLGLVEVTAPVSGIVVSKEVDSLTGKRFSAGEPFCEILAPGDLWVTIYVPEDRVGLVRTGQVGAIYLNAKPEKGYPIEVREVSSVATVIPRLGNVYAVRAPFSSAPGGTKVGMKGIGKINTESTTLFHIIRDRIVARWNQFSIYF